MVERARTFCNSCNADLSILKRYEQPLPAFTTTEAFKQVLASVQDNSYKVIHIYGLSGSGKSQIVLAVCKEVDDNPDRIIWHIQCQPGSSRIRHEWAKFIGKLLQAGLINPNDQEVMENALRDDGQGSEMGNFLRVLNQINIAAPILMVVEDVDMDQDTHLVKKVVESMRSIPYSEIINIQLLIATRERNVLYPDDDLDCIDFYASLPILGFTKNEAMKFLHSDDEVKASKLAEELAYSPLGLSLTKSYCRQFHISYEEYYNSLGKDEDIVRKEKEILKQHHDLRKNHRYEVVMKLMIPNEEGNEEKDAEFKVMKMTSFLHNRCIPNQIIETFFRVVTESKRIKKQEISAAHLLGRLQRDLYATMREVRETRFVTLHADILRAVNVSMTGNEKTKVLSDVVLAFASVLDKDNRNQESYGLLYNLKDHAQNVIKFCNEENLESIMIGTNNYEVLMGLSRINEVVGFAISQHPGTSNANEEDSYYEKAVDCIWRIVLKNFAETFSRLSLEDDSLILFKENKDAYRTAKRIFEMAHNASTSNQPLRQALMRDWLRVFKVKQSHITDMKKRLGENVRLEWARIERELKENGDLLPRDREQLASEKMIIIWDRQVGVYLVERIASILHSRGRQDEMRGDYISKEKRKQCAWYADLGFHLCDIAFKETGIKSSFHYILRANNMLPRLSRSYNGESDSDFLNRITKTRAMAHALRNESGDFYEHGIYKRISDTPWTVMYALRFLVKANTQVYKRPHLLKSFPVSDAIKECEELYKIATNSKGIVSSTTCLARVGKFRAAGGDFLRGLEALQAAFLQGIDQKLERNSTTYSWALYNYGRAIVEAGNRLEKREDFVAWFERKYKVAKIEKLPPKLRTCLNDCRRALQQMQTFDFQ